MLCITIYRNGRQRYTQREGKGLTCFASKGKGKVGRTTARALIKRKSEKTVSDDDGTPGVGLEREEEEGSNEQGEEELVGPWMFA